MLKVYKKYLSENHYAVDTITVYGKDVEQYLKYVEEESMELEQVRYKEILPYFFQLKKEHSDRVVKRKVLAIRHLYDMLKVKKNPVSGIQIKIRRSSSLNTIVSYQKLIDLYQECEVYDNRTKRNKVMLGVLIYQGVSTSELQALRVEDLQIGQQQIYIRSSRTSNSRHLKLVASQLLDLQEYLLVIRSNMLHSFEEQRPGRRPKNINPDIKEKLFFSESGSVEIKNSLKHLFRKVKKSNPQISSVKVIRSTVIAEWLKTIDVRKVQYMSGHKYVSSTERYKAYNLGELKESLKKYHPLK